jgi:prolyl 4-hydroxylase
MRRLLLWLCVASLCLLSGAETAPTCSADENELDPALQEITFEGESFLAYVQPHVTSFYKGVKPPPASKPVAPLHEGFAAKFFNLSNQKMFLYWESYKGSKTPNLIRPFPPFHGGGTASFPGHLFFFSHEHSPKKPVHNFVVGTYPESLYVYDPYRVPGDPETTEKNLSGLTPQEREKYDNLRRSVDFNQVYFNATGRSYLVNYPRPRPSHYMWRADYFDQEHWVTTRETHFTEKPPADRLAPITTVGKMRALTEDEPRILSEYREKGILNMTLKVLSCAPRVFEIQNFLSQVEVNHILDLAKEEDLHLSMTGESGAEKIEGENEIKSTRTSFNSWLAREKSPIVDSIYRRAADLLRIDEALLRHRGDGEHPDFDNDGTVAESLQLVHYEGGQEYTAHHDFGYSAVDNKWQNARFATLLFYLNEGMVGGTTEFPRWVNAETFHGLEAVPEVGKVKCL